MATGTKTAGIVSDTDYTAGSITITCRENALVRINVTGPPDLSALRQAAKDNPDSIASSVFAHIAAAQQNGIPTSLPPLLQSFLERLPSFTRRVYASLLAIPAGRVISYRQLAAAAGSPGASRAAAHAMRTNPFPLLIPCHRVIRADGSPGGYAGIRNNPLKTALLRAEGISFIQGKVPKTCFVHNKEMP